jgi:outer membrane protein assembly factor BamD
MRILMILMAILTLAACSSDGKRANALETEQELYEKASKALDESNYFLAVENLQKLGSEYPFGNYSEQAQLELIYAQFKSQELEGARASAERFIRLHQNHANVDYAYYMKALTTYELGLSLVERYFSDDQAMRDDSPARESFQELSELIGRFPTSEYAYDARQRMIYLRDRLALHDVHVARYYLKRHAYLAAANRGKHIIETYQGTTHVAEGLAIMTEGYQLLGQQDLADNSFKVLVANFPDHAQIKDGKLIASGWATKDRRTLWNVITFGLID